ncbi:MAG TPA: Uma2 family endonuclease [Urbifossiella sp.]|nr:Uma2 family endonuclease [Urbifossiella sp.]
MTTATETAPPKVWTAEDLLAMPDDGVERWIINGRLREKPPEFPGVTMTVRNRHHCEIMSFVTTALTTWLRTRPKPRGGVYCGEVGVLLPGRPTAVGVDAAFAPADVVAVQDDEKTTLLDGVPTLVVEILSPNDTQEQTHEKTREYLRAGVALVWVIDPEDRTVKVYRPGVEPELFNLTHRMPEHPAMPGFAPAVAELFE